MIDIDALGAEIDVAGGYGAPGGWARWIRDCPDYAIKMRADMRYIHPFLIPFAERIAAAGAQELARLGGEGWRARAEQQRTAVADAERGVIEAACIHADASAEIRAAKREWQDRTSEGQLRILDRLCDAERVSDASGSALEVAVRRLREAKGEK